MRESETIEWLHEELAVLRSELKRITAERDAVLVQLALRQQQNALSAQNSKDDDTGKQCKFAFTYSLVRHE